MYAAAALVAVGAVVAIAFFRGGDGDAGTHPTIAPVAADAPVPAGPAPVAARPVTAGSAAAAVQAFFAAEAATEPDRAYGVLDSKSQQRFGSVAAWVADQANRPQVRGFTVGAQHPVEGRTDAVDVEVGLEQRATLDPFVGFIPARTRNLVRAVHEGSGWRVLPDPVDTTAVLPSDATAAGAVQSWLDAMAKCDRRGAARFAVDGAIVGPAYLPDEVCTGGGAWKAGLAASTDDAPSIADLISAYGPDVAQWARVVPASGHGSTFLVAVAPLGDAWRVFGTIDPGGGGSG